MEIVSYYAGINTSTLFSGVDLRSFLADRIKYRVITLQETRKKQERVRDTYPYETTGPVLST